MLTGVKLFAQRPSAGEWWSQVGIPCTQTRGLLEPCHDSTTWRLMGPFEDSTALCPGPLLGHDPEGRESSEGPFKQSVQVLLGPPLEMSAGRGETRKSQVGGVGPPFTLA